MLENEDGLLLTKTLSLSRNEALYLDDSLTMMLDTAEGLIMYATMRPLIATAQLPAPADLIEKIAVAVLFTLDVENRGQEAEIYVSEGDLYCLRELAQSYIRVGDEPVGFNLKKKIYKALYGTAYTLGQQLEDVLDSFPLSRESHVSVAPRLEDDI